MATATDTKSDDLQGMIDSGLDEIGKKLHPGSSTPLPVPADGGVSPPSDTDDGAGTPTAGGPAGRDVEKVIDEALIGGVQSASDLIAAIRSAGYEIVPAPAESGPLPMSPREGFDADRASAIQQALNG